MAHGARMVETIPANHVHETLQAIHGIADGRHGKAAPAGSGVGF
jgi:hypothetical protein